MISWVWIPVTVSVMLMMGFIVIGLICLRVQAEREATKEALAIIAQTLGVPK